MVKDVTVKKINEVIKNLQEGKQNSESQYKFLSRKCCEALTGEDSQSKLPILPLGVEVDHVYFQGSPAGSEMRKKPNSFDYGVAWGTIRMFYSIAYMVQNISEEGMEPLRNEHYEFIEQLIENLRGDAPIKPITYRQYRDIFGWLSRIICGEGEEGDEKSFSYIALKVNDLVVTNHFTYNIELPRKIAFDYGALWGATQMKLRYHQMVRNLKDHK